MAQRRKGATAQRQKQRSEALMFKELTQRDTELAQRDTEVKNRLSARPQDSKRCEGQFIKQATSKKYLYLATEYPKCAGNTETVQGRALKIA
jgi:hypothetical protein